MTDREGRGDGVSDTPWTPGPWTTDGSRVFTRRQTGCYFQPNYIKASDARLISKAPEMAELLEELADAVGHDQILDYYAAKASALLAEIKGETHPS